MTGGFKTYAFCGKVRNMVRTNFLIFVNWELMINLFMHHSYFKMVRDEPLEWSFQTLIFEVNIIVYFLVYF